MKKRKWIYVCKPQKYDITCNVCGGVNIEWSEFEHKIWCYDCELDVPGTPGIFDGPIPMGTMEILGAPLWRVYLKSHAVCKPVITKAGKVVYRKMKKPREKTMEGRKKENRKPEFNIDDRNFNIKAWYLKNTETSKGDALIEVKYNGKIIREFIMPAYKIWNISAHFSDIVDGELSKDDKERGYDIALSTF